MQTRTHPIRDQSPSIGALDARTRAVEEALSTIWVQQRNRTGGRVAVLERAIAALAAGRLDAGLRGEAQRAAHQLAGTVGIFGFLSASQAAGRLEVELERPACARAPALFALLQRISEDLAGEVVAPPSLVGAAPPRPR
jgi:hypothetical protein